MPQSLTQMQPSLIQPCIYPLNPQPQGIIYCRPITWKSDSVMNAADASLNLSKLKFAIVVYPPCILIVESRHSASPQLIAVDGTGAYACHSFHLYDCFSIWKRNLPFIISFICHNEFTATF